MTSSAGSGLRVKSGLGAGMEATDIVDFLLGWANSLPYTPAISLSNGSASSFLCLREALSWMFFLVPSGSAFHIDLLQVA
jgi:hypothetical protein